VHQEHRHREQGCRDPNDALHEYNRHLALELILLQLGVVVWPYSDRRCIRQQVDVVVTGSRRR
jgi:hypothetical protein